jgi:DNA ligase-1
MGDFKPSINAYEFLINRNINLEELNSKPFPFLLANTFEEKIFKDSINDFQFEWKYDGIRMQIIKRSGNLTLWTRGQELVNKSFPELVENMANIKDDFVLDGELLVWNFNDQIAMDFSFMQKRINRKSPTKSIQKKYPIIFIAYDLLELNGMDKRQIKLKNRRIELEKYFSKWQNKTEYNISDIFKLCDLIYPKDWADALSYKKKSRENNTEGLIIKNKDSIYTAGRKKGVWWKYKVDPMQLDAVLIYAKGGSGRRAGLYTDYSFALWKDNELIKFASAYSGLTNIEIKELDKWIRNNTIEKFGPVRSLKPEMVFEISFEKIQISKRHKSGIAVRFPRITKWRKDKKINDADSLDNAYKLMSKIS